MHECSERGAAKKPLTPGARLAFRCRGPGVWGDLTSVKFIAQDENYQWLNTVFGVWEGTIDVNNGTLHYSVYAASNQLVGDPEGQ